MKCNNRSCKNIKNVSSSSRLCPPCDANWKDYYKRQSSQDRQQKARETAHISNRNISLDSPVSNSGSLETQIMEPSASGSMQTGSQPSAQVPPPGIRVSSTTPPPVDLISLQNSYRKALSDGSESPLIVGMCGLMLNINSRLAGAENVQEELKKVERRLDAVEAKVGGPHEVADNLGLAIRNLPFPNTGFTDLDVVRELFYEIRAPGVDVNTDIIKVVRKLPSRHNTNPSQHVLGTVLVEVRNDDCRANILRNKHVLEHHPNINIKML